MNEKEKIVNDLKIKYDELMEKMVRLKGISRREFENFACRTLLKKKLRNYRKKMKNYGLKIIFYFKKLYEQRILLSNTQYSCFSSKDERNEQVKQKDVIVEATNLEIGEKEKEIEELRSKVVSEQY